MSNSKVRLETFTKERRGEEETIHTQVDRMLQKEGTTRAHYLGCKFNGVNLRTIMSKANKRFGENGIIRKLLLEKAPDDEVAGDTRKICDDVCLALRLWDGVFSDIHKVYPSKMHCSNI